MLVLFEHVHFVVVRKGGFLDVRSVTFMALLKFLLKVPLFGVFFKVSGFTPFSDFHWLLRCVMLNDFEVLKSCL